MASVRRTADPLDRTPRQRGFFVDAPNGAGPETKKAGQSCPAKNHQRRMCGRLRRSINACYTKNILSEKLEQTHYFSLFFAEKQHFVAQTIGYHRPFCCAAIIPARSGQIGQG
jgi:hypothetical protein